MRWNHPDQGLLPPSSFVQLAEESGLISALGDWALERAVRTLAGWLDRLPGTVPFVMHVNVSPAELRRPELAERVLGMLDRHRVVPARLALEIAETGLMTGAAQGLETLHMLRSAGVGVHIDDFGTGYSSISYLRRLPIDAVKLDQSLIDGIADQEANQRFVRAVLRLVGSVGLSSIVEGVQSAEQAAVLRRIGATVGQGFHFGVPMVADELLALAVDCWGSPESPRTVRARQR